MALVLQDRVKENSTTSGTGTITLAGAYTGYRTFASCLSNGDTTYYCIHNLAPGYQDEWEVGLGTYSSGTLSRDTVLSSSAGGTTKVNFTAGSGGLEVFITYPAAKSVYEDSSDNVVQNVFTGINVTGTATINVATLTSGTISTTPSTATSIANKQYVDTLVSSGITYHAPVRVESPTNLNATYNNGSSGVGATLTNAGTQAALVIDGITLSVNDRVLVYTQTNQTQNGIYVVTDVGSGSTNWVLTRASDANTYGLKSPTSLGEGDAVFVQQGVTGAGETYVCNTQGTITFGTTNITFVQVSSAQIYSAGTGLNLTGVTFSIANTGVSAATYGTASQVPQIAVNAQGQITSASNVAIAITASNVSGLAASATTDTTNASNITTGTLANGRTTATAANGANTIVLRDASGDFAADIITANGFTGSGANLTSLNASAISTGTIANARTTATDANGASTIVARDANGSFTANVGTFTTVTGAGSGITAINASNISTGTLANARTTAASANGASTIVARDASGNFSANTVTANLTGTASNATVLQTSRNVQISGGATAANVSFNGSADVNLNVTALNASVLSTGTVPSAQISGSYTSITGVGTLTAGTWNANAITDTYLATISTAGKVANSATTATSANGASTIVARDANGSFSANVGTFTTITGSGSGVTNINASNISTGTLDNARTSAASANGASTIVARDASGNFTANTGTFTTITGAGSGVTSLNASNLASGTVPTARLASGTANNTTYLRGDSTWAALSAPNNGTLTMNVSGTGLSGSATFTADQAGNSTFTVTSNASSANGASTIVARDASGNFTAATITATTFSGSHSGSGANLTNLNATAITTGTIDNARTTASSSNGASTIVARDASGNFTANVGTFTTITGAGSGVTSLNASNVSSGTLDPARLGTASNVQFASLGVGTAASGTAGEIRATNNITAYFSDDRLKTKLGGIPDALTKLKSLEGFYYEPNQTAQALGYEVKKEVGVSAQQVQAIMPEVVAPAPIDDKYLTVRYERLVPLLIEAIKELETQVAELKKGR